MIDLHIHTNNSDGTCSVKEILEKAEKLGLTYISITDHESCGAYKELEQMDIQQYYNGTIIPGVELKSMYNGRIIDVLGYNIDTDKMSKWLEEFYKDKGHKDIQTKYLKKHCDTCKKLGIKVKPIEEIKWDPEHDWANPIIYREIKCYEENKNKFSEDVWEDFNVFRHHYCYNKNSEFYIDKSEDYPSVKQVIDAIHGAEGKAFVAHVFIYKWAEDKKALIKDLLDNYDFDGMECYYSRFTEEQIQYVLEECKKRNLYCSGGCDYHGNNSPDIKLGIGKGGLNIPNNLIQNWI